MTKKIAALLTVHNRKEKTLTCLSELQKQQLPIGYLLDTWLTNDGCTDGTPEAVSLTFPTVHIIQGDGTLFWNRGMYAAWTNAVKNTSYDFYLWLNDDTFLFDGAIEYLIHCYETLGKHCIVAGATCLGSCSLVGRPSRSHRQHSYCSCWCIASSMSPPAPCLSCIHS